MKTVLISGGSTGIGLATVKLFARKGYKIYSISRNKNKISFIHDNVEFLSADVSNVSSLEDIFKKIQQQVGCIDILVNNAGMIIPGGIESLSFEEWNSSLNTNLSGYFNTIKVFLPLLKNSESSCIVNVSSISAKLGGTNSAYSVAKAGVNMLTEVSARELAKYNIRVNTVSPGIVNSGFQIANGITSSANYTEFLENIAQAYPLGVGDMSEISKAIDFLSSEDSGWITGSNLTVDGGKSILL